MEIAAILKLVPMVLTAVEVIKRFIPDRKRNIVNPVLAVITGLVGAYMVGGTQEVLDLLMTGVLAAAGAIGAYKIPKAIGAKLGIS